MNQLPTRSVAEQWHVKTVLLVVLFVLMILQTASIVGATGEFNWVEFGVIWKQMLNPDWAYMTVIIPAIMQTIQMALVGTLLGAVFALPISLLASNNIVTNPIIRGAVRFILNIVRAIPEMLLAAVFVAIVGIGPMAGVLAVAIFSFGMISKLFYEAIETIDEGPLEALTASGANMPQKITFAIIPQVLNQFASYFLYALEINIRSSTVLGYVGAGGVGLYLEQTMSMFRYDRTIVVVMGILVVVILVDALSNYLREALS
ncbi:phosphonate ABC transporter, permease protein PhnE [Weissella ceti]|uniref:phosphonate ABC transporter, permease protein PhnE n=1 Tax=Weissella ceti TaxID=759620 RepID=UPI001BCB627B|nr:phosphonate ABC transporter, permease protein PhnE [Weissella ceti]QVK11713.1 phosphonate ABC transporter, permease protein PhnE [Weissella ceti]